MIPQPIAGRPLGLAPRAEYFSHPGVSHELMTDSVQWNVNFNGFSLKCREKFSDLFENGAKQKQRFQLQDFSAL